MIALEFAICRCGFRTPIQPSMIGSEAANQKWIETGGELPFVACEACKRLYRPMELEIGPSTDGLSPYRVRALQHVFHVSIPCDELGCESPIEIIAVRSFDTSEEALQKETAQWKGNVKCPYGHMQPFPSAWK